MYKRIAEMEIIGSGGTGPVIRAAITFFIGICNEDRRNINDYQDLYHEIHVEAYGEDD